MLPEQIVNTHHAEREKMKRCVWAVGAASVFLLAACQTAPVATSPIHAAAGEQKLPLISSLLVVGGKGVPNGRSDSPDPYFRTTVLRSSSDATYGYTAHNPVHTGPVQSGGHKLFLNSLRGPQNQPVAYERKGACCHAQDARSPSGQVVLDVYAVRIDGNPTPVLLYVDMYRPGEMLLPAGFSARKP